MKKLVSILHFLQLICGLLQISVKEDIPPPPYKSLEITEQKYLSRLKFGKLSESSLPSPLQAIKEKELINRKVKSLFPPWTCFGTLVFVFF